MSCNCGSKHARPPPPQGYPPQGYPPQGPQGFRGPAPPYGGYRPQGF